MSTTALDIFNSGLYLIGEPSVANATFSVTGASSASGTVTLTIGTHPFVVGNVILVEGNTTTQWNGFQVVTAVTSTTVSFANSTAASTGNGDVRAGMPYDGSKASQVFIANWKASILFSTLVSYPWARISKEAALSNPSLTPTASTADGTTITLTVGAHTLSAGQTVYLNGSVVSGGNATTWDGTYSLSAVTATTISFLSSLTGTPSTFGTVTWAPLMDFSFVYTLPADLVRAVKVNNIAYSNFYTYTMTGGYYPIGDTMPPFRIEGSTILSDQMIVYLKYVYWDNVAFMPPQEQNLIDLLAAKTATILAMPITRRPDVLKMAQEIWVQTYRHARMADTMQGSPEAYQEDRWITARI